MAYSVLEVWLASSDTEDPLVRKKKMEVVFCEKTTGVLSQTGVHCTMQYAVSCEGIFGLHLGRASVSGCLNNVEPRCPFTLGCPLHIPSYLGNAI